MSVRSMREFCERYLPQRHAARECDCWPVESESERIAREILERVFPVKGGGER